MSTMTAKDYLMLPWSIKGPVRVSDEYGNVHYEMRVLELPDFMVAGETESSVLYEFRQALLVHIESYVNEGEVPPHPAGEPMEYLVEPKQVLRRLEARIEVPSPKTEGRRANAELVTQ